MRFRVYYHTRGNHTHCRLFVGRKGQSSAFCGSFVVTNGEFEALRVAFSAQFISDHDHAEEVG